MLKFRAKNKTTRTISRLVSKITPRRALPVSIVGAGISAAAIMAYSYGPMASIEPEAGSVSGGASIVADSNASGGSVLKFGSSTPDLETRGWNINSSNVGLEPHGLSCDTLPLYTGPSFLPANTTITEQRIETQLVANTDNIVIERSCIRPTGSIGMGTPLVNTTDVNNCSGEGGDCLEAQGIVTIRDSELSGENLSQQEAAFSLGFSGVGNMERNYIHSVGSGIALYGTGMEYSANIENNYVTSLVAWGDPSTTGSHSDAFTIRDFNASANPARRAVVKNNRFDCASGNDSGAFFIQTSAGNIDNVEAEGNFLEGQGYQFVFEVRGAGRTYSNLSFTNNRFSGTGYGTHYQDYESGPGWAWSENYRNDPGQPDNKGALVPRGV